MSILLQILLGTTITVWYLRAENYLQQKDKGGIILDHAYMGMIIHFIGAVIFGVALKSFIAKSFNNRLIFLVFYISFQFIVVASILSQVICIVVLSIDFQSVEWFASCVRSLLHNY